jgi:hypothetical protein
MTTPCAGLSWLFDSTHPADHLDAREHCLRCPIREDCLARADRWSVGTWGGLLFGAPVAPCAGCARTRRSPTTTHGRPTRASTWASVTPDDGRRAGLPAAPGAHEGAGCGMSDARKSKAANSQFYRLMDRTDFHIRVPNQRGLGLSLIGHAVDLHGPEGCCTCCHGRGETPA